jgi:hypothetical protein
MVLPDLQIVERAEISIASIPVNSPKSRCKEQNSNGAASSFFFKKSA